MSRHRDRWTALSAGVATVIFSIALAAVRLPFVVWSPGQLTDMYAAAGGISVSGTQVFPVTGHLMTVDVAVTGQTVTLGHAVRAYYSNDQAVLPQAVNFPVGQPIAPVVIGQQSAEVQRAAEAAALGLAGQAPPKVVRVASILSFGPSYGRLQDDDIVNAVGSTAVTSVAEFNQAVATHTIGDTIQLTVTRGGKQMDTIDVVAQASNAGQQAPALGVRMQDSYDLGSVVVRNAPSDTSAGLMLALAVYDKVTPLALAGNLTVAGVGQVDASGVVSGVAGVRERLQAAQAAGAQVFLLPSSNCANASLDGLTMTVVAVTNLGQAVVALQVLAGGGNASQVPTCPT